MNRLLITGVGSLIGQGIIKSIKDSSLDSIIIGTDYFPSAVGLYRVNKGYILPDILRPEISESEWVDALIQVINKEKVSIVLPGLDFEISILARNKKTIEQQTGSTVLVSSKKIGSVGNDKWDMIREIFGNMKFF